MAKNNRLYWSILVIVGIWFFLMNCYTPFAHDDFAYAFYYSQDSELIRPTSTPIVWSELPSSMWHHYCCVNGRFTSHVLVQIFCGLLNKNVFNICNSLVLMLMLHMLVRISFKRNSVMALCFCILAMLLFFPFPGQTMLWITGSLNYLWTVTFALCIVYYILNSQNKTDGGLLLNFVFFLGGLFVGWMQESVTVGLSGALFIWFLVNRNKFNGANAFLSVGLWIGTALIVFSPGTFNRINTGSELTVDADFLQLITSRIFGVSFVLINYLLPFVALVIGVLNLKKKDIRKRLDLPFLLVIMTFVFDYALGMAEARIFFGLVVFSLLYILCYFNKVVDIKRPVYRYSFVILTVLIFCVNGAKAFNMAKAHTIYTDAFTKSIIYDSSDKVILKADPFGMENKWVMVLNPNADAHGFHNRVRAFYYGKKSIQVIPQDIFDAYVVDSIDMLAKPTNKMAQYLDSTYVVYEIPESGNWLIKFPLSYLPDKQIRAKYTFNLDDNKASLTNRQKVVRYLLNIIPPKEQEFPTFTLDNAIHSYLFMPKEPGVEIIVVESN